MLLYQPPTGIQALLQRLDPTQIDVAGPMGAPDPRALSLLTGSPQMLPEVRVTAQGGPTPMAGAPAASPPLLPPMPEMPPSLLQGPSRAPVIPPAPDMARPDLQQPNWVDRLAAFSARLNGNPLAPTAEQIVENRRLRAQQVADLEANRVKGKQFMAAMGKLSPDAPDYLSNVYRLATAFGMTEPDKVPEAFKAFRNDPIKLGKDEKLVGATGNTLATGFRSSDWKYQAADRSAPARFVNPTTGEFVNVPGDTKLPENSHLIEVVGKDGQPWNAAWNPDSGKVTMLAPKPDTTRQQGQQQYLKQAQAFKDLKDAISLYRDTLKKTGVELWNGENKLKLTNAYANLKLQAKEAANLGALTGPDMGILEQLMQDPTSVLGAATGNLVGQRANNLLSQLAQYGDIINKREQRLNEVYGRAPSGPNLKEY